MGNSHFTCIKDEEHFDLEESSTARDWKYSSGSEVAGVPRRVWCCSTTLAPWRKTGGRPSEGEVEGDHTFATSSLTPDAAAVQEGAIVLTEKHIAMANREPSMTSRNSRGSKASRGSGTDRKVSTPSTALPDLDQEIDWNTFEVPVAEPLEDPYAASEPGSPTSTSFSPRGGIRDASPKMPGRRRTIKARMTDKLATVASVALQVIIENPGKIKDYYDIGGVLGEGSFGTVRKGKVKATQAVRAVKVLSKERMKDQNALVQNEIETLKMADHPNVVRLYEIFEDGQKIYLVMEFCAGGSLQQRIDNVGIYSERESAQALQQVLRGVYYLHKNRIAHRDLKPENCLLSRDGIWGADDSHMKLVDFGLATKFKPDQIFTQRVGTNSLMAPEIFEKKYQADAVDMWSVGCICYYTMCGEFPFEGQTTEETTQRIRACRFAFDKKEFVDISNECVAFIKCLLVASVRARATAHEALNHDWLAKKALKNKYAKQPLSPELITNLKSFRTQNKLKRAALNVIVSMLSEQDLKAARQAFISLDVDGDGHLSVRELQERLNRTLQKAKMYRSSDVTKIFEDREKSEVLYKTFSYTEFLAATFDRSKLTDEVMFAAFCIFDKDGSQTISMQELVEGHLLGHLSAEELNKTLEDLDTNGDNNLDFEEFTKMMRN